MSSNSNVATAQGYAMFTKQFEDLQIAIVVLAFGGVIGYFAASAWLLANGARKASRA